MINLIKYAAPVRTVIVKNLPTILTCFAVGGVITTSVLVDKAAKQSAKDIAEEEETQERELETKEKVVLCWKHYAPAVGMGAITIGCVIGANHINIQRNLMLAGLYATSEVSLKDYKKKVEEMLGEKKANDVQDAVNKDRATTIFASGSDIIRTGNGDTVCVDAFSGRIFSSDIEFLRKAINEIVHEIQFGAGCMALNDWYYRINLDPIKPGDDIGWNISELPELYFTSMLRSDGTPALVVDFRNGPYQNYQFY